MTGLSLVWGGAGLALLALALWWIARTLKGTGAASERGRDFEKDTDTVNRYRSKAFCQGFVDGLSSPVELFILTEPVVRPVTKK